MTAGQGLVEGGVVPSVELVDDHLPDWVGPAGTVLGVPVALVGHPTPKVHVLQILLQGEGNAKVHLGLSLNDASFTYLIK